MQDMLWRASRLRSTWQELLSLRLEGSADDPMSMSDPVARAERSMELEAHLSRGLIDFVHSEALFSIKRLLPADIKVLYVGEGFGMTDVGDENPFNPASKESPPPHPKKGGFRLTEYLTYNCLENQADELHLLASDWTCPKCEAEMYAGPVQRIAHHAKCVQGEESDAKQKEVEAQKSKMEEEDAKPNAREYFCHECEKTLWLSSVQILKHKRGHS